MNTGRISFVPILLVALATAAFVSCGGDSESPSAKTAKVEPEQVSAGGIRAGDAIPAPKNKAILSISGLVSNTNEGDKARIDLATLEKMPMTRLRVYEPFEKKNMSFEGVLMSDLMKIAGANASARKVHFTALDDYKVDLSLKEVRQTDILLATKADGKYMSIVNGGPTRIIFPTDSPTGRNSDMWIWNVEAMVVR